MFIEPTHFILVINYLVALDYVSLNYVPPNSLRSQKISSVFLSNACELDIKSPHLPALTLCAVPHDHLQDSPVKYPIVLSSKLILTF